ncbi:hypothetical protein [Candidatus Nitrosocosmicus sp. FF01]|uniref:hypothetical protein n=1 Tax=Candidatus Nitrosocosmicus sp. FF01 TaxID=3397670 RepID=UPI0039E9642A
MKRKINIDLLTYPIDSRPFNKSFNEWTANWWQWLLSIPTYDNPITETTNGCCETKQSGPVWFLASTMDTVNDKKTVLRKCTVPSDKALLIPILNYGATLADEPEIKSEEDLVKLATSEMDKITKLTATIDQMEFIEDDLKKLRIRSPLFDVTLPTNNITKGIPGHTRGAAEGYWLFLKPLSKGFHTIETLGSCKAGTVTIEAKYNITVAH